MGKKLYVSDLDGTLLRDDAVLSPYSRDSLNELIRGGVPFTVASARSLSSIGKVLTGLDLRLPVIEYNGSSVSDLNTGEHLIVNNIKPDRAGAIYDIISELGGSPFISTYGRTQDRIFYRGIHNEGMKWYLDDHPDDDRLQLVDDVRQSLSYQVIRITIIGRKKQIGDMNGAIRAELHGEVETDFYENPYQPGWYWLTVHDRKATKDQAIRALMGKWGLDEAELVVFGNGQNDIPMLRAADRAVVVSNAAAEVKSYASELIGSNNDDCVAKFIRADVGAK